MSLPSRWAIIERSHTDKQGVFVHAVCECGTEKVVLRSSIVKGTSRSCGCFSAELTAQRMTVHGLSKTPEYHVWEDMIQRCTNPNEPSWADYGGRGITVCDEWRDFPKFYADMGPRPKGLTLDRINNDGNYEPGNCRWTTYSVQNTNRRETLVCRNGHLRTEENTLNCPDTSRGTMRLRCRDCDNESRARYVARNRWSSFAQPVTVLDEGESE